MDLRGGRRRGTRVRRDLDSLFRVEVFHRFLPDSLFRGSIGFDGLVGVEDGNDFLADSLFGRSLVFDSFIGVKGWNDFLADSLLFGALVLDSFFWIELGNDFMADASHCGAQVFQGIFCVEVLDHFSIDAVLVPVLNLDFWLPSINVFDRLGAQSCRTTIYKLNFGLVINQLTLHIFGHFGDKLIDILIFRHIFDELLRGDRLH